MQTAYRLGKWLQNADGCAKILAAQPTQSRTPPPPVACQRAAQAPTPHSHPPHHPTPARRKAYRLGKWLQNANALRKLPLTTPYGVLEWVSNGGEGLYYFVEQLTWWVGGLCFLLSGSC